MITVPPKGPQPIPTDGRSARPRLGTPPTREDTQTAVPMAAANPAARGPARRPGPTRLRAGGRLPRWKIRPSRTRDARPAYPARRRDRDWMSLRRGKDRSPHRIPRLRPDEDLVSAQGAGADLICGVGPDSGDECGDSSAEDGDPDPISATLAYGTPRIETTRAPRLPAGDWGSHPRDRRGHHPPKTWPGSATLASPHSRAEHAGAALKK